MIIVFSVATAFLVVLHPTRL